MRLLVLDTALHACTAACVEIDEGRSPRILGKVSEAMRIGHAEALMPMVETLFADLGPRGLDRIAVTTGPGSFTGLRVALSAARGLALALRVPAYGVGTLAALAGLGFRDAPGEGSAEVPDPCLPKPTGPVAAVLDARRGDVYIQPFARFGDALGPARVLPCAEASGWLSRLHDGAWTCVGSGGDLLGITGPRIDAAAAAALHIAILGSRAGADASPPRPLYLRDPDAKAPRPSALGATSLAGLSSRERA